jgi:uncharacterized membrane protein
MISQTQDDKLTFGQRMADLVAAFGGSWQFILLFGSILLLWTFFNGWLLLHLHIKPFDPYPYIFLNLLLSMLAAVQAPLIMMSQNRQAEKDRLRAIDDFAINTKAEEEVAALHGKIDAITQELSLLRHQLNLNSPKRQMENEAK